MSASWSLTLAVVAAMHATWSGPSSGQLLSWPSECDIAVQTLLVLQRSQLRNHKRLTTAHVSAEMQQTFATFIEPQLPSAVNPRIIDIGPGLAMYHIYIARHYSGRSDHFLVDSTTEARWDRSRTSMLHTGGWHGNDSTPLPLYGGQDCARAITVWNGVSAEHWHSIDPTKGAVLAVGQHSADLVMSLLSMGFHYPVSTYASAIYSVLKPRHGRLLVTLRKRQSQQELVALGAYGFACTTSSHSEGMTKSEVILAVCSTDPRSTQR